MANSKCERPPKPDHPVAGPPGSQENKKQMQLVIDGLAGQEKLLNDRSAAQTAVCWIHDRDC